MHHESILKKQTILESFDDDDDGSDLIFVPVPLCGRPLGGLGEGSGEGTVAFLGCF